VGGKCVITECPDEDCWTLTHKGSNRYKHILQTKLMDLKTLDDGETGCVTKNPQKCGLNIAKPICLPFDCYDWNTNPSTKEHTQNLRKFHDTNTLYDAGGVLTDMTMTFAVFNMYKNHLKPSRYHPTRS
jgi:uncharacterized protein RhaS with RHS repeats